MNRTLLEVKNLSIGHDGKDLFSGMNFDICEGDCIMLCGANGSGKSTLLRALSRMDDRIVLIPSRIPKIFGFTLSEFVRLCCFSQSDMGGRLPEKLESKLEHALERLGLSALAGRDISTLSDGEFQKACIASALVREASIILLDEPTAFLDAESRISVLSTLRSLSSEKAIIFSTHDLHEGAKAATRVFALGADGQFRCSESNEATGGKKLISTIFSDSAIYHF